jgi:nitrate/nitrite-specific signal transduction histidine kinase
LDDSLQTVRSAAKNQFALIRYETEKNKADFLKAQAENIKKQNSITMRNIGLGILIVCLIAGYFWYRKRQKTLKQEKELEVKNTELKYAKKVHDRVANRVYQVMSEVENTSEIDKDDLADKLDVIYNISRDLSRENIEISNEEHFSEQLNDMLYSYQSAKVDLSINGNEEKLWNRVKETAKSEVFYILQELMTNMKKHSEASGVSINFEQRDQRIEVFYTDNGTGIKDLSSKNGLKNTETRIESISGLITFDSKPNKGLKIQFSFPI